MDWKENIKSIMRSKGISIKVLNSRIESFGEKLSRNSISNILNGKSNPKIETLALIAKALEVDLFDFFQKGYTLINELNGFVEFDGRIYRVTSHDDLMNLVSKVWEKSSRTYIPDPLEPF